MGLPLRRETSNGHLTGMPSYLEAEGAKVDFFGINIMLMVITFLVGIVLLIFFWMVRMIKKAEQMKEESSGWRLVLVDVFRTPSYPSLLCVMVGNGVQILGLAMVSLVFASLGFMSLVMGMFLFSMIPSVATGYVAVRLWRKMNQKGRTSIGLKD